MAKPTLTHYLNADFDLGLRPRPAWQGRASVRRQVEQLSAQAMLGADEHDSALVRCHVPEEFLSYLHGQGIPAPRLLRHPETDPQSRLSPLGWSVEAMELNRRHHKPVKHPAPAVIEHTNSRSFSRDLEAEMYPSPPPGVIVTSTGEVESMLASGEPGEEWILKAEHGNSGLANRRLRTPALTDADDRFLANALAEDDRLVVEPWLDRTRDWCVVFGVPFRPSEFRIHETVYTRDGAMIGALFEPTETGSGPWYGELRAMAGQVAGCLEAEGYWGPVCVDAFEFRSDRDAALRPLADLNCRRSMSDGAYRFWQRNAPDRCLYYRFFNCRKLSLPDTMPIMQTALGEYAYDSKSRCGTLLASPLRMGREREIRPSKLAVVFMAEDRTAAVKGWLDASQIARPTGDETEAWSAEQGTRFLFVIVQPYVLAQRLNLSVDHE